jgi:hypothetical protein
MKALFIQNPVKNCGVFSYGHNLYQILHDSTAMEWHYCEPETIEQLTASESNVKPDVMVYNYSSLIGGVLLGAPFPFRSKQVLVFHDCHVDESKWDLILFSDPRMTEQGKWKKIGRPIPAYRPVGSHRVHKDFPKPIVGVHGFIGAWSDQVVHRVLKEFEFATVRLSLPYARYGDSDGAAARTMADRCKNMVKGSGVRLDVSHEFIPQQELIEWLHANDLNCYIRPADTPWRGVSSAPDMALAAMRPLAINRCAAFRHLFDLKPSICIEDNSLFDIIGNGLGPTVPLKVQWSPETIRNEVEATIASVL